MRGKSVEPIILWQTKWSYSLHVPLYLFFGGLTAGIFLVAVVADLLERKWPGADVLSKVSSYSAVITLALAGFFLTAHLGKPERGLAFPLFFTNSDSWMTRGGWIVGGGTLLVLIYAALRYRGGVVWLRRLVGLVGLPVLVMLAVYTGLLLSRGTFVPLWSSKYLPILFLNSGVTTGLAASGLIGLVALWLRGLQPHNVMRWVSMAVALFILLELFEIYNFMTYLAGSGQHAPTGEFVAPKGGAQRLPIRHPRRLGPLVLVGRHRPWPHRPPAADARRIPPRLAHPAPRMAPRPVYRPEIRPRPPRRRPAALRHCVGWRSQRAARLPAFRLARAARIRRLIRRQMTLRESIATKPGNELPVPAVKRQ